eukprot:scaffold22127_cov90-Isochrysis_galbana.AAC.2
MPVSTKVATGRQAARRHLLLSPHLPVLLVHFRPTALAQRFHLPILAVALLILGPVTAAATAPGRTPARWPAPPVAHSTCEPAPPTP